MPQPAKPGVDWQEIERRYKAGETSREIAKDCDVSRQAIDKRVKKEGWRPGQPSRQMLATAATICTDLAPRDRYGLRTPENMARVLELAQEGLPMTALAAAVGMTPPALKAWRDSVPDLDAAIMEAYAINARRHMCNVGGASDRGDARAGQWILERNPLTKEAMGGKDGGGGVQLIVQINVPRSMEDLGEVIEG